MCSAVGLVAEAGVGTAESASHPPQESCQSSEAVAGSKSLHQGPSVPGSLYSSCCGFITLWPIQIDKNNKHKILDSHGLPGCSEHRQSTEGMFGLMCG